MIGGRDKEGIKGGVWPSKCRSVEQTEAYLSVFKWAVFVQKK